MNGKIKITPDKTIYPETDADAVNYDNGTLKAKLDSLNTFTPSTFGKKLMQASKEEIYSLLGVAPHLIVDECGNYWGISSENVKPGDSSSYAAFSGDKFIACAAGSYTLPQGGLKIGTQPFTISFFTSILNSTGTAVSLLDGYITVSLALTTGMNTNDTRTLYITVDDSKTAAASTAVNNSALLVNKAHFEFCYDGTNTIYCFLNGALKKTYQFFFPRKAWEMQLGGSIGCFFNEFRVLDGVCEHTSAFTKPTAPYTLTNQTVSLVHFD